MLTPEWRAKLGKAAALTAALIVAYTFGLYSARKPDLHEEAEAKHTVTVITKTRIVYDHERDAHQDKVVRREFRPDGTLASETERTVTDEHERTRSVTDTDARADATSEARSSRTVTTPLPDWRLGAHVGAAATFGLSPSLGLEVGGALERRLLGPLVGEFYVSVRPLPFLGTSPGIGVSAGLGLKLEF